MLIDVSQKIERGSVYRLGTPPVEIAPQGFYHESEGKFETTMLTLAAHTATHIDLVHRDRCLGLGRMIGRGKLLDVTQVSGRQIRITDIKEQVRIQNGDFVFFRTDWSTHLGTELYYAHPELSLEVVDWLAHKEINMVGIDALGLGRGRLHQEYDQLFADHDVFVIENLTNLSAIPSREFRVFCFPLRIEDIDAIPTRVVVETYNEEQAC